MKTYEFQPRVERVGALLSGQRTIAEMEREIGVYSATPDFVQHHCGPIANGILARVPYWYFDEAKALGLYPNIDVRIHRLYPGDFPAYPGWHCDGEFRETYFSQPDLDRIKVSKHITCTVSSHEGGVSCAQFLAEPFTATVNEESRDATLWGQVHAQVEKKAQKKLLDTRDGDLMLFDCWTLHRAMPARVRGWRLFFRMSMWHRPNLGDGGMISKQEQVYKVWEGSGW